MTYSIQGTSLNHYGSGQSGGLVDVNGFQIVKDWYLQMALMGKVFQVRAGTITTPIAGDVLITDAKAEMAVAAASGITILPISANISLRIATGTLNEAAGKSVGAVTMSGGTAFVPLPLKIGGPAASSTAMVGTAGGVTVAAEVVTTTRRHFAWSQPIAAGAWPTNYEWNPRTPPPLVGPSAFYIQVAATGTAPDYYAHFDFVEVATDDIFP